MRGATSQPSLHDLAKLDTEQASVDGIIQFPEGLDNLSVAAAGTPTSETSGLIATAKEVCADGASRGATDVADSRPLCVANDIVDLMPVVDYVIRVVRSGITTKRVVAVLGHHRTHRRQGAGHRVQRHPRLHHPVRLLLRLLQLVIRLGGLVWARWPR